MTHLIRRVISSLLSTALLLLCFCPALSVSAASDPMVMTASFGDFFLEYRYNTKAQVVEMTNRSTKEVTLYEYHASGNVKKETTYQYNTITSIREYDYSGNITGVATLDHSGKKVYSELYANKYDERGRLVYFMMSDGITPREEAYFSYNTDGSFMVEWESYSMYNNQKMPFMHRIGHFDKEGRMIYQLIDLEYAKEHYSVSSSVLDQYGNPALTTYLYHMDGYLNQSVTTYHNEYDSEGRLLSVKAYTGYDDRVTEMTLQQDLVYSYDSQGRKTKITDNKYGTDSYWEYDSYGNLVACGEVVPVCSELDTFLMQNDGAFPQYRETVYEYMPLSKAIKKG